jgi:hypothetical protein
MTPFHFAVISMIVTGIAVILKKKRTVCERAGFQHIDIKAVTPYKYKKTDR